MQNPEFADGKSSAIKFYFRIQEDRQHQEQNPC